MNGKQNPLNPLIEKVFELNKQGVIAYRNNKIQRQSYLAKHPIHPVFMICMDGRANHFPQACDIPIGVGDIVQTAGAKFSVSAPYFANLLAESAVYAMNKCRTPVFVVASHFSSNYPQHGCRAFGNNRQKALEHVFGLAAEIRHVFRKFPVPVAVFSVEFDTDDDSVIFFGNKPGLQANMADFLEDKKNMRLALEDIYDSFMNTATFSFILEMAEKNIDHIKNVHASGRCEQECHHGEFALGVGRGFGTWLNPHRNQAIILFGEGLDIEERICVAGNILLENMERNPELKKHGAVVISSAAYSQDWKGGFAMERTRGYSEIVRKTFSTHLPRLPYHILEGVVDMRTWEFIEKDRWSALG